MRLHVRCQARVWPIVAFMALAGCDDPGGPDIDPRALRLALGEVRMLGAPTSEPILVHGDERGAEFTLIPVSTAYLDGATVGVQISGEQLIAASGPPSPRPTPLQPGLPETEVVRGSASLFHAHIASTAAFEVAPAPVSRPAARRSPAAIAAASAPAVGELVQVNATINSFCGSENVRSGRVAAVTERAVIITDVSNPEGGFTDDEYRDLGGMFDQLVYPVIAENFGAPSDIDDNGGRVVIFFTRVVNELTPSGAGWFIDGFYFWRDLLPKAGANPCPGSNEAELLYVWAPDPAGQINGNVRTKELVRRQLPFTLAFLSQYLVNFSRRVHVHHASELEQTWLLNGLGRIASELVALRAAGLAPRQNITHEMLASQSSDDAAAMLRINLWQLRDYLANPAMESPYGPNTLATVGAAWQLLRYIADRSSEPERTLWSALVNSPTSGAANLEAATGVEFGTLLRDWAIAQYTDDAGFPVSSTFQHPSWNFRSVLAGLTEGGGFPLLTQSLEGGPVSLTLVPGGAGYVRFGVGAGRTATIRVAPLDASAPATALSDITLAVVRTK